MAIGGSKLGDLIGIGPAYNGQFNCTAAVFGGLHAGAGGNDLRTVYLGSLRGTTIPSFRSPVAGLPMVHWK